MNLALVRYREALRRHSMEAPVAALAGDQPGTLRTALALAAGMSEHHCMSPAHCLALSSEVRRAGRKHGVDRPWRSW